MNYGAIKFFDVADGPGVRVTLFVSGCHIKCPGCQNACAQDFHYGELFTEDTLNRILTALKSDFISGFTLCGGEPFSVENQAVCAYILSTVKKAYPNKSIWCYTGYSLGAIPETDYKQIMFDNIDVIVDGPYLENRRDISDLNRWRGSTNQRVIDLKETRKQNKKVYVKGIPNNNNLL